MAEITRRLAAAVMLILIICSSQMNITVGNLKNTESNNLAGESSINSTEIRIHNRGDEWQDSEILEWYPNHLSSNRTMQFSIMIHGANDVSDIHSSTLNMTWIYNVSTNDHLLSVILNYENFIQLQDGLLITYNFTYPSDIFYGRYLITLETIDLNGNNYSFNHQGIEIMERGFYLSLSNNEFTDSALFANNQVTEVEFLSYNTGTSYTSFDMNLSLTSSFPASWEEPEIYNYNASSVWGGESVSSVLYIQSPIDIISSPPPESLELQLIVTYENDLGDIVELYNNNYSFNTIAVPKNSIPRITSYRDSNFSESIINSYTDYSSDEIFEKSIITKNGDSISLFLSIENYGFEQSTFKIDISSESSADWWEVSAYTHFKNEQLISANGFLINEQFSPLDLRYIRLDFNFINASYFANDEVIIRVTNIENNEDSDLSMVLINTEVTNPISVQVNSTQLEPIIYLSSIKQNDSFSLEFIILQLDYYLHPSIESNYTMHVEIGNSLTVDNVDNLNLTISRNEILVLPHLFSFKEKNKMPYSLSITTNEDIDIGLYCIIIILNPSPNSSNPSISFEQEIKFEVIENTSLTESELNNNSNSNNSTNSTNSTNGNSTIPENNSIGDNSTDGNLTNNTINEPIGLDSDGDGINDELDDCPATQLGLETDIYGCSDGQKEQTGPQTQDSDDSSKAESNDLKSWVFISLALIVFTVVTVLIIRRRVNSDSTDLGSQQKEIIEITTPLNNMIATSLPIPIPLTILQQWTDDNGHTWRQMSDRSVLWWNGAVWVPVNQ